RPKPSRATNAAGISMFGHQYRRIGFSPEHIILQPLRHIPIQARHLRNASAEYNHVRVENVDELGEAAREAILVALQTCHRRCFSGLAAGDDLFSLQMHLRGALVIGFQACARDERFDAATKPAVAVRPREFFRAHPRQHGVAPFPGNAVAPVMHAAIYGNAPAATGSQYHRKHNAFARPRAIGSLRYGQAVGVVRTAHLAAQRGAQVAIKRLAVHPHRVCVFHRVRDPGYRAGNAYADGRAAMQFALDVLYAFLDGTHGAVVIESRRWHAVPVKFAAVALQGDELDFCASQIDADAQSVFFGNFRGRGHDRHNFTHKYPQGGGCLRRWPRLQAKARLPDNPWIYGLFQSSVNVSLPSVLVTSILRKVSEMSSRGRGSTGSPSPGTPRYRRTLVIDACVSFTVSKTDSWPRGLVRTNSKSTLWRTSLLVIAARICGEAAPHSFVNRTLEYWRLPVACPLDASRAALTCMEKRKPAIWSRWLAPESSPLKAPWWAPLMTT